VTTAQIRESQGGECRMLFDGLGHSSFDMFYGLDKGYIRRDDRCQGSGDRPINP
jgi:hypothetical protein